MFQRQHVSVLLLAASARRPLVYTNVKRERKIAYCESPRYDTNKARLEELTRIVCPFSNGNDQEWPTGETEIDLTLASKETIGRVMLWNEAQTLIQQREVMAKLVEKWIDPAYGKWMGEDDVDVDKIAPRLGELWKDFSVILDCCASKMMTLSGSYVQGDELSNEDTRVILELVGLVYQCKRAIYRIGELVGRNRRLMLTRCSRFKANSFSSLVFQGDFYPAFFVHDNGGPGLGMGASRVFEARGGTARDENAETSKTEYRRRANQVDRGCRAPQKG